MEDQAAQLRRLVEGKNINIAPKPISPVQESAVKPVEEVIAKPVEEIIVKPASLKQVGVPRSAAELTAYSRGTARTIAITSGKGGVGKTSLSVNLAIAMGLEGKRVVIIDADLGMANVDILLNTESKHSMMDLLKEDVSLDEVIQRGPYGVSYISGGSGMEHAGELTEGQRATLFRKLSACDEWADVILIDTGAGIGRNVQDFITAADEVILLTTPEPTAITDAYAMMKAYSHLSEKKEMKLVVNRVYDEDEGKEVVSNLTRAANKFLKMHMDCIGYIYEDRSMLGSVRKRTPLLSLEPESLAAKCIKNLAENIIKGRHQRVRLGWQGFLRKLFKF